MNWDTLAGEIVRQADEPEAHARIVSGGLSGGAKFIGGLPAGGGAPLFLDHAAARRQVRTAMQDSTLCRSMVVRNVDTIVDTGLRLELKPDFELLGITREAAEEWSANVEGRFHLFMSDKKQHRAETLTGYQGQRMWQFFVQRDNDVFLRFYYNREAGLQNPLQFEFVDPDQIRGDALTTSTGFQDGDDGIERDVRGREIAYKIWQKNQNGTLGEVTLPAKSPGGRVLMLHGFRPEYAGQGRGFPRLTHALQEFSQTTDFSLSVIQKAVNQANMIGFIENQVEDPENAFEGMLGDAGAGPAASLFGSDPQTTCGITPPSDTPGVSACYDLPEAVLRKPGSTFFANLNRGSTIKFLPNMAPADSYDKFVDAFASYLSAATSTPIEMVLMRFSQNFSASRATLLLFWRVACIERAEMDADFLSPLVEMWISEEIAAGRIAAPGFSDPRLRAAWLRKSWMGIPVPDIDPAKSARARKENIEMNVTSIEREAQEYNGSSAAGNSERNKKLYEDFANAPWGQAAAVATQPEQRAQAALEELAERMEDMSHG